MPALFDTYRFTANDGTTDTTVAPVARGLRRRWERDGDTRAYRVKLATKLLFKGADYTYFRDLYDAGDCTEITLLIERYCAGVWETWHDGIIPIYTGDYNASRCEVTFEVRVNDVYECANKQFDVKENWLEYATPTTILASTDGATIETITCTFSAAFDPLVYPVDFLFYKGCWGTGTNTDDNPDPALAWRPIAHTQDYNFIVEQYQLQTTWARETIDSVGAPDGDGWINIGGTTWVRPANIQYSKYLRPPQWPPPDGFFHYIMSYESQTLNAAPVSNGRKLSTVLEAATDALECDFDAIVSNFFNINPDATNPSNTPYTYAAANFADVFFFQKSDIVRSSVSNDATRFTFSMKEFLEELKILNVFHSITNVAGVKTLRIEHYTYWQSANGPLNLATLEDGKYIVGRDDFKTDAQVPNFESFAYQESYRPAFTTKRITYPPACATTQGDERTSQQLNTDFGGLVENPDAGLEGFFLMATLDIGGGEYLMNTLGGEANGAFAWTNALPALWADGRFHADATANVTGYVVNSVRKTREQAQIAIPFCCDTFEPSELINTQLGWGEVKAAEEDTERGTLKLNLLQ